MIDIVFQAKIPKTLAPVILKPNFQWEKSLRNAHNFSRNITRAIFLEKFQFPPMAEYSCEISLLMRIGKDWPIRNFRNANMGWPFALRVIRCILIGQNDHFASELRKKLNSVQLFFSEKYFSANWRNFYCACLRNISREIMRISQRFFSLEIGLYCGWTGGNSYCGWISEIGFFSLFVVIID